MTTNYMRDKYMNTDTIEFRVIIIKHNSNWIARAVDYTFIAQGLSPDSAIDCLVGCIGAQYSYDKSKNIEPLSKHKTKEKIFSSLLKKTKIRLTLCAIFSGS